MIQKPKRLTILPQKEASLARLMVVGDSQSGKSSFVYRLLSDKFAPNYTPTLGVDHFDKRMEVSGTLFNFNVLDFSGKQEYLEIRNQFYKQASVVLLFLDLSSKKSVDLAQLWFSEAKDNGIDCPIIVIGSKCDSKKVSLEPERYNGKGVHKCFEISSKDGTGIQQLISEIAKLCK